MLCPELNRTILRFSPVRYNVADSAPGSYLQLRSASVAPLTVWSGGSLNTIYGDPAVNWAFRAWHDSCHLLLGAEFTLQGEILVASYQASKVGSRIGDVIMAEVKGQAEHFAKHGEFPVDQLGFIRDYLKKAA